MKYVTEFVAFHGLPLTVLWGYTLIVAYAYRDQCGQ